MCVGTDEVDRSIGCVDTSWYSYLCSSLSYISIFRRSVFRTAKPTPDSLVYSVPFPVRRRWHLSRAMYLCRPAGVPQPFIVDYGRLAGVANITKVHL